MDRTNANTFVQVEAELEHGLQALHARLPHFNGKVPRQHPAEPLPAHQKSRLGQLADQITHRIPHSWHGWISQRIRRKPSPVLPGPPEQVPPPEARPPGGPWFDPGKEPVPPG